MIRAVVISFLIAHPALADCACEERPIVIIEDPLILVQEGVDFHAEVDEVYFNAGECVVFITYPDGATSSYTEATGHRVQRLKLAPRVAAYPAFAGMPEELTLSQVSRAAADICWSNAPTS